MMGWGGAGRQAGATALPARRGARRWNRKEGPSVSDEPHKKVPVLAMNRTFVVHNICCTNTTAARRQSWRIRLHLSPHAMSMHSLAIHVISLPLAVGLQLLACNVFCYRIRQQVSVPPIHRARQHQSQTRGDRPQITREIAPERLPLNYMRSGCVCVAFLSFVALT